MWQVDEQPEPPVAACCAATSRGPHRAERKRRKRNGKVREKDHARRCSATRQPVAKNLCCRCNSRVVYSTGGVQGSRLKRQGSKKGGHTKKRRPHQQATCTTSNIICLPLHHQLCQRGITLPSSAASKVSSLDSTRLRCRCLSLGCLPPNFPPTSLQEDVTEIVRRPALAVHLRLCTSITLATSQLWSRW